ncbi:MAG: hypothetical protein AABZ36_05075, partial [Nitrospirota bacterium]
IHVHEIIINIQPLSLIYIPLSYFMINAKITHNTPDRIQPPRIKNITRIPLSMTPPFSIKNAT